MRTNDCVCTLNKNVQRTNSCNHCLHLCGSICTTACQLVHDGIPGYVVLNMANILHGRSKQSGCSSFGLTMFLLTKRAHMNFEYT